MNIFFTSASTYSCAEALDDKRLNKMVLETAQLLATAIHHYIEQGDDRLTDDEHAVLYRKTHYNHPSSKFARHSHFTFDWLYTHFTALAQEYTHRTGKSHLAYTKMSPLANYYQITPVSSIVEPQVQPFLACDADLKKLAAFTAYRKHMLRKWLSDTTPTWTKRQPPDWAIDYLPHAVIK